MITETQWRDRQLNEHLQGEPELPEFYEGPDGNYRSRDTWRIVSRRQFERQEQELETRELEPDWRD